MRGQHRFSGSIPHVGLVRLVNEHPQKFYQTGFRNTRNRSNTTISGVDFFRINDSRTHTVCCFSVGRLRGNRE